MIRGAALVLLAAVAAGGSAAPPVATSRPAVTGTLQQGGRLTVNPGSWSANGAITFSYQWSRCNTSGAHCSSIHGATGSTYTQVRADVGATLTATVEAQAAGGTSVAYTPVAGLVAAAGAPFAATAQPALVGDAFVGGSLAVSAVRWTASAPLAAYRWLRCNQNGRLCGPLEAAHGVSYTIAAADVGHVLVSVVTASRQSVLSMASAVVRKAPGPLALSRPALAGTLRVGAKLSADTGVWSEGGTIAYTYQWYRCSPHGRACSTLRGATRSTYTMVPADAGHAVALTVRATDSTGTGSAYSSLAGVVAPATGRLAPPAQPPLEGIPAVGRELHIVDALAAKGATTTYLWLRCRISVRSCVPIPGAVQAAYTVTKDDAGHTLVAAVTTAAAGERLVTLSAAATVG